MMEIEITKKAQKQIKKIPTHIRNRLKTWMFSIRVEGLQKTRRIKSYHDESLKGKRRGQRSIRLSKSWRTIYREEEKNMINLIIIEEVNKHDY